MTGSPILPELTVKQKKGCIKAILWTGFLAGTLDALAALVLYFNAGGKNALVVFQYIASGLIGPGAFSGGYASAGLGLLFHYLIALSFTIFYFMLWPKIVLIRKYKVASGFLYGVFIWLVMNVLVLPLSLVPESPFDLSKALIGMIIIIVAVGLPISLLAHKFYSKS